MAPISLLDRMCYKPSLKSFNRLCAVETHTPHSLLGLLYIEPFEYLPTCLQCVTPSSQKRPQANQEEQPNTHPHLPTHCLPVTIWSFQRWTWPGEGRSKAETQLMEESRTITTEGQFHRAPREPCWEKTVLQGFCVTFRSQVCLGWTQAPKKTKRCSLSL